LITSLDGVPQSVIGVDTEVTRIGLLLPARESLHFALAPNERKSLM
jgi:hypothetical protein